MDRHWRRGVLFPTLIYWTLIGLCCAGHRPYEKGERPRYARHHDRWAQRIQYPSLYDQGTQRIEYPSVNDQGSQVVRYPSVFDRGQTVQYPSDNDSSAGSQIQVKSVKMSRMSLLFCLRCGIHHSSVRCRLFVTEGLLSLKTKGMLQC